jgi:site-specific recombinase XerD
LTCPRLAGFEVSTEVGFVASEEPALVNHCQKICVIPFKRAPIHSLCYLEHDEMQALLATPDQSTSAGRRDRALVLFLYNTGARVQELTGVRAGDLSLDRPLQVLLRGKGRKERLCPLWQATGRALLELIDETGIRLDSQEAIFRNARGEPLTRFGVHHILTKHALVAAEEVPSLKRKRLSPHVLRHTAAVHMLNAGVDINVIRSWLGHVDLRTTNIYAEVDLTTKRKAVETCAPPRSRGRLPSWKRKPDLLSWLEEL